MRKALLPMLACLALCGAATTAMVISSAHAQPGPHKPMMVSGAGLQLAANDTAEGPPPGPPPGLQLAADDNAPPPPPPGRMDRRDPAQFAARMKQMCQDRVARQAGELAYLEARLQLTPTEQPLFQHWKDARLSIAHRQADKCAARPMPQRDAKAQGAPNQPRAQRPSPADRMAREEDMLKQRLADLESERPALTALYSALSPEQKMALEHGSHGDMGRRRFADARGPHGPMGPGMGGPGMGRGPMMGPMGPGAMGPDGPPQER